MRRRTWAVIALCAALLLAVAGAGWVLAHRRTADVHRGTQLPFTSQPEPTIPTTTDTGGHPSRLARFGPAWPVYGRTMTRRRDAADLVQVRPPYSVVWRRTTGFLEYPPSYRDGVLYLTTDAGVVSARRLDTGSTLWQFKLHTTITAAPAVVGHLMYFGARDGFVYAVGTRTGHFVWRTHVGAEMESSPAYAGGRLYMTDIGGHVRALDMRTGHIVWTFKTSGPVKHGPALSGGRLYFGDYAGVMYCIDASTGHLIWRRSTNGLASGFSSGNFYATPALAYGRIYIGNTDGKVYAFEASNGQIAWTYTMPDWAYGSPAVWAGHVYESSYDGTFVALSARTGALLWTHHLAYRSLGSPTVIGPNVYVADLGLRGQRGHLYAYNAGTGRLAWRMNDGKYSTVIAAHNWLIVAGFSQLYALRHRGGGG
jgi:outer membrane protein assembly factor BamB